MEQLVHAQAQPLQAADMRKITRQGWRDMLELSPAMIAWGIVTGMAMIKAGLTLPQAFGMTLLVFAGAAQVVALPLIIAQVPIWMIFAAAMIVNLRFLVFSVMITPKLRALPWYRRLLDSYLCIDIVLSLVTRFMQQRKDYTTDEFVHYQRGVGYCSWLCWQGGSIAGILLAGQIPPEWQLGFMGTMVLLALLVPMLMRRSALVGAVVAGVVSVLCVDWPYKAGMMMAVVCGLAAAMTMDWLRRGEEKV